MSDSARHRAVSQAPAGPFFVDIGLVVETDSTFSIVIAPQVVVLGIATETDSGLAMTAVGPTDPVNTVAPVIVGTVRVGHLVGVTTGEWS